MVWAATLWSVLIKRTGPWARPKDDGSKPFIAYFVAGTLAVLSQVAIYGVIKFMIVDDPSTVLEYLPRTIPWSPLVFFMAFVTSWQCDHPERPRLRWREALIQGTVIGVTAWIAYQIIDTYPAWGPTGSANAELWTYVAGGTVLGCLIGALVPDWYRTDNNGKTAVAVRAAASERPAEWQPA